MVGWSYPTIGSEMYGYPSARTKEFFTALVWAAPRGWEVKKTNCAGTAIVYTDAATKNAGS